MSPTGKRKHIFQPGTKALMEIRQFQKSIELLIPKLSMFWIVKEILQKEQSWLCIQACTVLAIHEATEAYLVCLMEGTNLYAIHAKHVTILPKGHTVGTLNQRKHQVKSSMFFNIVFSCVTCKVCVHLYCSVPLCCRLTKYCGSFIMSVLLL